MIKNGFDMLLLKENQSLTEESITDLEPLSGLAMLSGWTEVFFALMVCAISLSSFYLKDAVNPWLAF